MWLIEQTYLEMNIILQSNTMPSSADCCQMERRRQFPKSTLFYLVIGDVAGFDMNQIFSCEEIEISIKATSFSQ